MERHVSATYHSPTAHYVSNSRVPFSGRPFGFPQAKFHVSPPYPTNHPGTIAPPRCCVPSNSYVLQCNIMAKKSKDEAPNPNSVTNRDVLQRMNFLYQASAFLNNLVDEPSGSTPAEKAPTETTTTVSTPAMTFTRDSRRQTKRKQQQEERRKKRHPATCEDLSRTYIRAMKSIGQKTNVRL